LEQELGIEPLGFVRRDRSAGRADVSDIATDEAKKVQLETITKLRSLSHDLSNYIETIMQASYLLAQAKLDDNNKKWLEMVDQAAQNSARINREIREILRSHS
jgi:K+-sensing histidine kinase KdpD